MGIDTQVLAVEGLDGLGKSTLIQGIQDQLGYYQVIHFSKPQKLQVYVDASYKEPSLSDGYIVNVPAKSRAAWYYQTESFRNSMLLAKSGARIIFDRWHLGEYVYSPLYRGYDGSYVFKMERTFNLDYQNDIRLILLTEDFTVSQHFVDDGDSLGPAEKRQEEQSRFIDAFNQSCINDKRIICVTDPYTGQFKPKQQILKEALQ